MFNYTLNGYVIRDNDFFFKSGISVIGSTVHARYSKLHFERTGINLQVGKYWEGIGAIRVGLLYDGPGIGGDLWLIYKDRFKWLTTLEFAANRVHGGYHYRDFKPFVKWLNRFFIFDTFYISGGINHFGGSMRFDNARTQGFIGFGSTI